MAIIANTFSIGSSVLFVWNGVPFTGRIKSIGTDSYGIICDADHYTTDLFSIPRSNDEIFVPQNICFRTGEIVPLRYRNSNVYIGTKFADTINAYQQLLKKTIFPCLSTATNHCDQFIEFIPGKHLFKFTDDYDYYMYIQTGDEIVTLMNLNDTTKTKIPNPTDLLLQYENAQSKVHQPYQAKQQYLTGL